MKHFLFALAAIALFSCNNSDNKSADSGNNDHMEKAKKSTEAIKMVYHAIETGDVSGLDSIMAEDVVDHNANPDGTDMKGRDNIKKMLADIHTYFDNLKMEYITDAITEDGTTQFTQVRMTGTTKANPWGMPVGKDIDDMSVDVVKIKDGKATDHWGFMSMKDFQETMAGMKMGGKPAMPDSTGRK
jgi:ketosteroid isomerase-like protein